MLRLRVLAARFDLDDLDVELLLAAMAPDVDDRFERYYGYLNDDVTRRRVSVGLALGLAGIAGVEHGRPAAPRSGRPPASAAGLLEIDDPDRPFLTRGLRVPDRVTAHVLGADEPDAALAFVLVDVAADRASRRSIRSCGRSPDAERVRLPPGPRVDGDAHRGRRRRARPACRTLVVDLVRVAGVARRRARSCDAAVREARLRGGVLVAGPVDALAEANLPAVQRLTASAGAAGAHRPSRAGSRRGPTRPPFIVEAPAARRVRRGRGSGRRRSAGRTGDGFDAADVTAQYRLGAGQIRQAAEAAVVAARPRRPLGRRGRRAPRRTAAERRPPRAPRPAHRAGVSWDDLVLPPRVRRRPARPRRPRPPPRAGARRRGGCGRAAAGGPGSPRCSPATRAPARR